MTSSAIHVAELVKSYGDFRALKGISFDVRPGEVFGLLGPNGSGKTSTLEILEGLRPRTSGEVRVLGQDPAEPGFRSSCRLGGQLQRTLLPGRLTVVEIFKLFASFHDPLPDVMKVLTFTGLREFRYHHFEHLSGGQQQRVALGLALLASPKVLFLDEPTVGLDPHIRLDIHDLILRMKAQGITVLLSTHYIEEAEKLCDRVGILVEGELKALGAPKDMIEAFMGQERIEVELDSPWAANQWECLAGVVKVSMEGCRATLYSRNPGDTLQALVAQLATGCTRLVGLRTARPTLEDAFLRVVGRTA